MRKSLHYLMLLLGLAAFTTISAQDRKCAANEVLERQIAKNPAMATNLIAIEKHTQDFIAAKRAARSFEKSNNGKGKPPGTPGNGGGNDGGSGEDPVFNQVTIPVIVHVVYKTAAENISDARVQEQIRILNDDFAATNADRNNYVPAVYENVKSTGAKINFSLLQIIRKQTNVNAFSTNDAMKFSSQGGSDAVSPEKNLNIWVCNMSGGILGYAQFPGGPVETDGVVVLYSAFGNTSGNYDKGRTATHEVGHYFNLRHIWGDRRCGSDLVDDTPSHDGANYGCPGAGATSNCKGPVTEMWMNYMDYTYDRCMYMFSQDQVLRMQATMVEGGPRAGMVTAARTEPIVSGVSRGEQPAGEVINQQFQIYPTLTKSNINVRFFSSNSGTAELRVFNDAGMMVSSQRIAAHQGQNIRNISLANLTNGIYFARLNNNGNIQTQKLVIQQ